MEDYGMSGASGLDLHHIYRTMAWLGEEMETKSEDALAPRCVKYVIEEKLFDKWRDLFADLPAVFMDTTSLSFYGEGGKTLSEHGYSKDYRPGLIPRPLNSDSRGGFQLRRSLIPSLQRMEIGHGDSNFVARGF